MAAVSGVAVEPRRIEHRLGHVDGDQRLGQPVADGLEGGDRAVELDAPPGVLAGQLEHGPGRSDQLVGEGQAAERHGGGPVTRRGRPPARSGVGRHVAGHLEQRQVGIDADDRPQPERGRRHRDATVQPAPVEATTRAEASVGEAGGSEAVDVQTVVRSTVPGGYASARRRGARSPTRSAPSARGRGP